jgi:hypothetical protein
MFFHEVQTALADGKKAHRMGWPKGDLVVSGSTLEEFELTADEAKSMGLKEGASATLFPETLVYVSEGAAKIGYALTTEDRNSSDWHVSK